MFVLFLIDAPAQGVEHGLTGQQFDGLVDFIKRRAHIAIRGKLHGLVVGIVGGLNRA